MNSCAKIISFIFWTIGTGLYLASMLTDYWATSPFSNTGLFNECSSLRNTACQTLGWSVADGLKLFIFVPRVVMLAAAVFVVIGILVGIVAICTRDPCPIVTEAILYLLGGLLIFGACASFTVLINEQESIIISYEFHYSYYFGWASGLMYLIAGICGMISAAK